MAHVTDCETLVHEEVDGVEFRFTEGIHSHSNMYGDYIIQAKWGKTDWSNICYYGSWAFSSCAVATLCGFNRAYNGFWGDDARVKAFIKWLSTTKRVSTVSGGYDCREYYLLLANDSSNCLR